MKKNKNLRQEIEQKYFRQWKSGKKWLYAAGLVLALSGVVGATLAPQISKVVQAVNLPSGAINIGSLNGSPVIKSPTDDMSSKTFQQIVDNLVGNSNGVQFVANDVGWQGNSQLQGGQTLGNLFKPAAYYLEKDGFIRDKDLAVRLSPGEIATISNVGSAKNLSTGEQIPLSLGIQYLSSDTSMELGHSTVEAGSNPDKSIIMGARNVNGVITLGWASPINSGVSGGEETPENGGAGGGTGSGGQGVAPINAINYRAVLLNAKTGQALPDSTLMAMKFSDIDGSQLAGIDNKGVLGYITSPDSLLNLAGTGLVSAPGESINDDTKKLSAQSYVAIKQWNNSSIQYQNTDNLWTHCDIVTGIFGNVGVSLNPTGKIQLDKTTLQYGKDAWNSNYSFDPLAFDVIDKNGKKVTTIEIDGNGRSAESIGLASGDYTLRETSSNWAATGQTQRPDIHVMVEAGKITTVTGDMIANQAVQGSISIDKSLEGYGKILPNGLYGFNGLQFAVKSTDGKFADTITIGADGKGTTTKPLPLGDYDVQEISNSVLAASGQVVNPTVYHVSLTYKDQHTQLVFTNQSVTNKPVLGQITVTKKGAESGTNLWNGNYSLSGNEFKITSLTDGKVYTLSTDASGKAKTDKIPLGKYKVEETKASAGFANTFKPVEVNLTYKDNQTELVFDEAKGTNQEIKGQNKLSKEDKETGKAQDGLGDMKSAQYQLFYNDTSTGSSAHKAGSPVKWTDIPKAKLLTGEKVTSGIINGSKVNYGDNVVIDVDDKSLEAAIGNLAIGKYYWCEVNAPTGYVLDPEKHEFEIGKKDDQTQNIVTPDTKSTEQIVKAKISIQKLAEIAGESAESGFNDVEFTITPINGTKAEKQTITTGINPTTDEDGYASAVLVYGDYVIHESKGIAGYENIKDIYIHMVHDPKTDILTISASFNKDISEPFSKRQFTVSDNATGKNPNVSGSISGNLTSAMPTISLSKMTFTDKQPTPETPSIDIEKVDGKKAPDAGQGNHEDEADNLGLAQATEAGDHDTEATARATKNAPTDISFRVTNNGSEALTNIKLSDKTIAGSVSVKDIKWQFKLNKDGEVLGKDGKLLVLKSGQTFTGIGSLPVLPVGELHGDEVSVSAVGVKSGLKVGDEDKWFGKFEAKPSIDVEKADGNIAPEAGEGNNQDKADNLGVAKADESGDHDTEKTALEVENNEATDISFRVTNNGNEDLTSIQLEDKTITGSVSVKNINWEFKLNDQGEVLDKEGKPLVLKAGETFTGKGVLPPLPVGELHGDKITVSAVGVTSKKSVGDNDDWYGKTPVKPSIDIEKANGDKAPNAGKGNDSDKDNNVGDNDHDTKDTALIVKKGASTQIHFRVTNNGNQSLTNIKVSDKTTAGEVDVKSITWSFKTDANGIVLAADGKPIMLKSGESFTGVGTLPVLPAGELHTDRAEVTADAINADGSVDTRNPLHDHDDWNGLVEKPKKITIDILPHTGEDPTPWILTYIGIALVTAALGFAKREAIGKLFGKLKLKLQSK